MNIQLLSKTLITLGIGLIVLGIIVYFAGKLGMGRLPGDIYVKKGNFTFYFPIVTCIIASIILTLLFSFLRK